MLFRSNVNINLDVDGAPRSDYLATYFDGDCFPSLALAATIHYLDLDWQKVQLDIGSALHLDADSVLPVDHDNSVLVNYLGDRNIFKPISFADIIDGSFQPGAFKNKLVIFGTNYQGGTDFVRTPFDAEMPGVTRHANIAERLVHGGNLSRPSWTLYLCLAAIIVLGGLAAFIARRLPIGHGISVPVHTEAASPPAWWALIFTLVADATLFTSLVFGLLFLWISAPGWPPAALPGIPSGLALGCLTVLVAGAILSRIALRALLSERPSQLWIGLTGIALLAAVAGLVLMIVGIGPQATRHAAGAVTAALLVFVALHASIGILFLVTAFLRLASGRASSRRPIDLRLARLWIDYTTVTGAIAIGLVLALPTLVAMLGMRP